MKSEGVIASLPGEHLVITSPELRERAWTLVHAFVTVCLNKGCRSEGVWLSNRGHKFIFALRESGVVATELRDGRRRRVRRPGGKLVFSLLELEGTRLWQWCDDAQPLERHLVAAVEVVVRAFRPYGYSADEDVRLALTPRGPQLESEQWRQEAQRVREAVGKEMRWRAAIEASTDEGRAALKATAEQSGYAVTDRRYAPGATGDLIVDAMAGRFEVLFFDRHGWQAFAIPPQVATLKSGLAYRRNSLRTSAQSSVRGNALDLKAFIADEVRRCGEGRDYDEITDALFASGRAEGGRLSVRRKVINAMRAMAYERNLWPGQGSAAMKVVSAQFG